MRRQRKRKFSVPFRNFHFKIDIHLLRFKKNYDIRITLSKKKSSVWHSFQRLGNKKLYNDHNLNTRLSSPIHGL